MHGLRHRKFECGSRVRPCHRVGGISSWFAEEPSKTKQIILEAEAVAPSHCLLLLSMKATDLSMTWIHQEGDEPQTPPRFASYACYVLRALVLSWRFSQCWRECVLGRVLLPQTSVSASCQVLVLIAVGCSDIVSSVTWGVQGMEGIDA